MARARKVPRLCRHKGTGQGYVTDPATRREKYFTLYGSEECNAAYDRWVVEFLARGAPTIAAGGSYTVAQLLEAYLVFAEQHYRKRGKPTSQLRVVEAVARAVVGAGYGPTPAAAFSPT